MCRMNASLAAGTGRYLWNPSLEDGGVASGAVPLHTEMQLPGGRPLASKPPVTATAASRSPPAALPTVVFYLCQC